MKPNDIQEIKKDLLALRILASRALAKIEQLEQSSGSLTARKKKKVEYKVTPEDHIRRILTGRYKT